MKALHFHNTLDKYRNLGDTSFVREPNVSFFWGSVTLRDFFPKNYKISLLTEMPKNYADIERVWSVSNFPSIKENFVGFFESMQVICHLSDRISG